MISEKMLSKIVKEAKSSTLAEFFDLATSMENVISLGVGEPDFPTPYKIRDEAIYTLEKGKTFYTSGRGLLELRAALSTYVYRHYGLNYDHEKEILITAGGSEAIDLTFRTILDPEDEVIVLSPAYVAYEPIIRFCQGKVVTIELKEENNFKLTKELLKAAITPKTKALLINFPSNPTGGIMTKEDYEPLIDIIKEHEIIVISDEIYAELTYGKKHFSIASFTDIKDQVIVISGFSKAFSMTGWRLGYILAHSLFIENILKIHLNTAMSPCTISQFAGITALNECDEDVELMRNSFEQRRNLIVKGFNDLGLTCHKPEGAFYIFPCIKSSGLSSEEFCHQLLQSQKVAVVPGTAFGSSGEGYIRCSYAYSIDEIKEALERIKLFLEELERRK